MAETLGVSLDYLVGFSDYELGSAIVRKILDIQKLNDEDKMLFLKRLMRFCAMLKLEKLMFCKNISTK